MNYTRTINIDGPAGNAINLIATAKTFAKDLGYTSRAIRGLVNQMLESNDYDRLVQIFLFYFGDYVTLIDREGESKNEFYRVTNVSGITLAEIAEHELVTGYEFDTVYDYAEFFTDFK